MILHLIKLYSSILILLLAIQVHGFLVPLHGGLSGFSLYVRNYEPFSDDTVTFLSRGSSHIVAYKPPSVVCHHSCWSGSRTNIDEYPMLQRVRDAIHTIDHDGNPDIPLRRVNLVHRLDRGASGALLLAFADDQETEQEKLDETALFKTKGATSQLIEAMASDNAVKTYVAFVRGEGILKGEDLKQKGWFNITRDIKDENGRLNSATTAVKFVAGQAEYVDDKGVERPRMSIVLARPKEGRWHQIRRHLNGISHPILGDSSHGSSTVNREWREKRNLAGERICLHMARMRLPPTELIPEGIDISCPLPNDMRQLLRNYAPNLLEDAIPVFKEEGIVIDTTEQYEVGKYYIPDELSKIFETEDAGIEIISANKHFVVAKKAHGIVVHDSGWTGKKTQQKRNYREPMPVLQRVRNVTGLKVNPIHRLDRGASGCIIFSIAENNDNDQPCSVTRELMKSMQSEESTKTYVAFVDGDGKWNDKDFLRMGWIHLDNDIKDENGDTVKDTCTQIRFAGSITLPLIDGKAEGRKISMVLAKPKSGKWHQIRQHLASGFVGHAILGDSSHGRKRTNRVWKNEFGMKGEMICLHLTHVHIVPSEYASDGIDVKCPLSIDMMSILDQIPELLKCSRSVLEEEGLYECFVNP